MVSGGSNHRIFCIISYYSVIETESVHKSKKKIQLGKSHCIYEQGNLNPTRMGFWDISSATYCPKLE